MAQGKGARSKGALLITGCSSGIGHHCAHGMAARGWRVVASCRRAEDVERLRGEGLASCLIDYADPASIEAGWAEALDLCDGRIDVLFNNGAFVQPGMVEDLPVEALRAIFETNFFGWHDLSVRALAHFRSRPGGGRIVQNSSILGFVTLAGRGAYNMTKFAIEGWSDTLRVELGRTPDIHVSLIEPGPVTSEIRRKAIPHFERWVKPRVEGSAYRRLYETKLMPRLYEGGEDRFELGPESVLKRLVHACEARRPQARYYVTTPTYVMGALKRVLPTRALDALLRRA